MPAFSTSVHRVVALIAMTALATLTACDTDRTTAPAVRAPLMAKQQGGKASLASLAIAPSSITGGRTVQGTVTLTAAAPQGDAVVTLASSDSVAATVPASVTVPRGQTSATFTIATAATWTSKSVTVTASYNRTSTAATLGVAAVDLASVQVSAYVYVGFPGSGVVQLTGPAPAGGVPVFLASYSPLIASVVQDSILVPEGQTGASFQVAGHLDGSTTILAILRQTRRTTPVTVVTP